jgi:hypothetical protein
MQLQEQIKTAHTAASQRDMLASRVEEAAAQLTALQAAGQAEPQAQQEKAQGRSCDRCQHLEQQVAELQAQRNRSARELADLMVDASNAMDAHDLVVEDAYQLSQQVREHPGLSSSRGALCSARGPCMLCRVAVIKEQQGRCCLPADSEGRHVAGMTQARLRQRGREQHAARF